MCVSANLGQFEIEAINDAVDALVAQQKSFSLWDVVTFARRTTKQLLGRYNELKEVVVEAFDNGKMPGYDVRTESFPDGKGGIVRARVYFPDDGSGNYPPYDPEVIKNNGHPQQTNAPAADPTASVSATDPNASAATDPNVAPAPANGDRVLSEIGPLGLTASYRLQVSPRLVGLMGLMPYQTVFQTNGGNEIRISKQTPGRHLEVNKDKRLRVNGEWLGKLAPGGLNPTDKFRVAVMLDSAKNERYLRVVRG